MNKQTITRGNVIVQNIKIGDIHYEYQYVQCCKSEVITLPFLEDNIWRWKSKEINTGEIVNYAIADINSELGKYNDQFGIKLYDYEAYTIKPLEKDV
jgi:hypothetical protein